MPQPFGLRRRAANPTPHKNEPEACIHDFSRGSTRVTATKFTLNVISPPTHTRSPIYRFYCLYPPHPAALLSLHHSYHATRLEEEEEVVVASHLIILKLPLPTQHKSFRPALSAIRLAAREQQRPPLEMNSTRARLVQARTSSMSRATSRRRTMDVPSLDSQLPLLASVE